LAGAAVAGASVIAGGSRAGQQATEKPAGSSREGDRSEDVSPGEDLMREHGVLTRLLLIYGEAARRLEANRELPPATLADSAAIVRTFIEDYHEQLEETYLFPRFRKANRLVELVDVLTTQHRAGRQVTEVVLRLASNEALRSPENRLRLASVLRMFVRMYAPHQAREDTILFPAFHELASPKDYDLLGEDFERKENELFGENGFEKNVDRVAAIEKAMGIYNLSQFTPKI